jgi:hypothetical protein
MKTFTSLLFLLSSFISAAPTTPPSDTLKLDATAIDESLYSRQMYVMGVDAMREMSKSNVLIYGLNGVGIEIAKVSIFYLDSH